MLTAVRTSNDDDDDGDDDDDVMNTEGADHV